jgi:hypothetical protein
MTNETILGEKSETLGDESETLGDEARAECASSALRRLARAAPKRLNAELPLAQLASFESGALETSEPETLDSGAERTCLRDSKELVQTAKLEARSSKLRDGANQVAFF